MRFTACCRGIVNVGNCVEGDAPVSVDLVNSIEKMLSEIPATMQDTALTLLRQNHFRYQAQNGIRCVSPEQSEKPTAAPLPASRLLT